MKYRGFVSFGLVMLLLWSSMSQLPGAEIQEEEKAAGFVSLFDGKSLAGWQGSAEHWIAGENKLVYNPPIQKKMIARIVIYVVKIYQPSYLYGRFSLCVKSYHSRSEWRPSWLLGHAMSISCCQIKTYPR